VTASGDDTVSARKHAAAVGPQLPEPRDAVGSHSKTHQRERPVLAQPNPGWGGQAVYGLLLAQLRYDLAPSFISVMQPMAL